jgi:hypothetical protein
MRYFFLGILMVLSTMVSCKNQKTETVSEPISTDNVLTDQEKADGWKLLFDGTYTQWMENVPGQSLQMHGV